MVVFQLKRFAKTSVRFINLRHLNLSVDGILRLAYLLEVAPVLEELELHFDISDFVIRQVIRADMPPYRHDKAQEGGHVWSLSLAGADRASTLHSSLCY
uniref:FBD domain-containing protein n=1 Tax=Oryza nivara TaxID=4536 RepID=A0A0E0GSQ1_ORYNI